MIRRVWRRLAAVYSIAPSPADPLVDCILESWSGLPLELWPPDVVARLAVAALRRNGYLAPQFIEKTPDTVACISSTDMSRTSTSL